VVPPSSVPLEFDPDKDRSNVEKHGISLARAGDLQILARVADERFAELRYRAYGLIGGKPHCLAYVVRGESVRAISLRRAHEKEFRRYAGFEDRL
jgi:hypothetical protein